MRNDTTLKLLLAQPERLLRELLDEAVAVKQFLPTDLKAGSLHVDLLIELMDGRIVHIELQGYPEAGFGYRMLNYRLRIRQRYNQVPLQYALWVGKGRPRIASGIQERGHRYQYPVIDLKHVDTRLFLDSASLKDNLFGLLGKLADSRAEVVRLLRKIAGLDSKARREALETLVVISGMRGLETTLAEEIQQMPIVYDLSKSIIVKRLVKELAAVEADKRVARTIEGKLAEMREILRQEGREAGREQGREETARRLLTLQLQQRYTKVPVKFARKIASADLATMETWALRLMSAREIDEVFA
ncbi:MAG TPA: hypothetical protein VM120_15045 [Bryobacteraceae bacterium]|nr:hypothetical protein [Bryobacteraceae bacterium]